MGGRRAQATLVLSGLFLALMATEIDRNPKMVPFTRGHLGNTSNTATETSEITSSFTTINEKTASSVASRATGSITDTKMGINQTDADSLTSTSYYSTSTPSTATPHQYEKTTSSVATRPTTTMGINQTDAGSFTSTSYYSTSTPSTATPHHYLTRIMYPHMEHNTEDLPDEACQNEDGVQVLQQGKWYDIFRVTISHGGFDEYTPLVITCQLKDEHEHCEGWVKSMTQHVSLEINGTVQDKQFNKEYVSEENVVRFSDRLHYESHHKAKISCALDLQSGARLVSLNSTIHRVDELHNYTITPGKLQVRMGESFALTCKTDSMRGLNALQWKVKTNDEGFNVALEDEFIYDTQESVTHLHSVLNILTQKDGRIPIDNYTFYCTERFVFHADQSLGEAKVIIQPHMIESAGKETTVSFFVLTAILFVVLW